MHGHQRRRTRGIHRHRRTLQPQEIRHPPRGHTRRRTSQPIPLQVGRLAGIALPENPGEHPGRRTPQRRRFNSGVLQGLPGALHQQSLLWIHRQRLTRGDPEEPGIKTGDVVDKPALLRISRAQRVRVGIKQSLHIPTPIGGKLRHHIPAVRHDLPQATRRIDPTREPAAHPHQNHRLVGLRRGGKLHRAGRSRQFSVQIPGQAGNRAVVPSDRVAQLQTGHRCHSITELHCHLRVETQLGEREIRVQRPCTPRTQDVRGLCAHGLHYHALTFCPQGGQPLVERRVTRAFSSPHVRRRSAV